VQAPAPDLALAAAAIAESLGTAAPSSGPAAGGTAPVAPDPFIALGRWRLPGGAS